MASILKVNTIQDATNSNTAMTVDSNGLILTPTRPSFKAKPSGNGTLAHDATSNIIILTDVTSTTHGCHNIGSHYSTSTGKFTAPISGVYIFNFALYNNSSTDCEINVVKTAGGSTTNVGFARVSDADNYDSMTYSGNIYMNASETVHIKVQSGTAYYDANVSNFSGFLIG